MNAGSRHELEQAAGLLAGVLRQKNECSPIEQAKLKELHVSLLGLCQKHGCEEPFHVWLERQRDRTDRTGDLARLADRDKRWPRTGNPGLTPYADRLRLTNLARGAPAVRGMSGGEMIERYLYPAWEEYSAAARRRQLGLISAASSR